MDQLIIKDLELFGFHGVHMEEKNMGQKFLVDVRLSLDLSEAGETDNLEASIHYGKLSHELQEVFTTTKHNLIEKAAHELCMYILLHYDQVTKVDLTLKKPWAPIHITLEYPAVRLIRQWHIAYIAVGSNMGNKKENIKKAMDLIDCSLHSSIIKKSKLIETDPIGYEEQDRFLNGVFIIKTLLTPEKLIRWLLAIEKELKRERLIKWGPRTIDLDVIYYDDIITELDEIVIPHPHMHERAFVLEPLNEIAPYKIHPIIGKRTFQMLQDIHSK